MAKHYHIEFVVTSELHDAMVRTKSTALVLAAILRAAPNVGEVKCEFCKQVGCRDNS